MILIIYNDTDIDKVSNDDADIDKDGDDDT